MTVLLHIRCCSGDKKRALYGWTRIGIYPGQYYDAETGLHYNWFRYYDASTGRYLRTDPIGYEGGANVFIYVEGNPINWIDQSGLERKPGKTPPRSWPPLPGEVGGKKPRWNPGGYWEGKKGRRVTWDDRSHGAGVDRGEGEQGGHWDDENSDNRWDEDGNLLPGSPDLNKDSEYHNPPPNGPVFIPFFPPPFGMGPKKQPWCYQ